MAMPQVSMRELIEAGVHFGHKTKRWNPKMAPYLYGVRNDIHIIDLQQTVPLLRQALQAVRDAAARGGRVLFVGTKSQASDIVRDAAQRCGQYYVNQRWLGGMLTNWPTIQRSIKRLKTLETRFAEGGQPEGFTKKEILNMQRELGKLESSLGGIKDMGGVPDLIFVIDTNREALALAEAAKLGIPVVAVLDSNSSLHNVTYPIPGNDDASRAIRLYCSMVAEAALEGLQVSVGRSGIDAGAAQEPQLEAALGEEASEQASGKGRRESGKQERKETVVVRKASRPKVVDMAGQDKPAEDGMATEPAPATMKAEGTPDDQAVEKAAKATKPKGAKGQKKAS